MSQWPTSHWKMSMCVCEVELGSEAAVVAGSGHGCTGALLQLMTGEETPTNRHHIRRHKVQQCGVFAVPILYVLSNMPVDIKSPRHVNKQRVSVSTCCFGQEGMIHIQILPDSKKPSASTIIITSSQWKGTRCHHLAQTWPAYTRADDDHAYTPPNAIGRSCPRGHTCRRKLMSHFFQLRWMATGHEYKQFH